MLAGKNTGALAFGGLALQALPQTLPMLGKRHFRQELSGDGVRGGAQAENGFSAIWSPEIASDDSKCFTCPEKWGYGTPSPKSGGTGTPRSLRLCNALSRHAALGLLGCLQRYAIYIFHSQCHNWPRFRNSELYVLWKIVDMVYLGAGSIGDQRSPTSYLKSPTSSLRSPGSPCQ